MKPIPITDGAEFDLPEAERALRLDEAFLRDGHTARTLVREPDIRIVLVVMRSGSVIAEHRSQEVASIHAVGGSVRIVLPTRTVDLRAGQLLVIAPGIAHAVEATIDSAFLLTLA